MPVKKRVRATNHYIGLYEIRKLTQTIISMYLPDARVRAHSHFFQVLRFTRVNRDPLQVVVRGIGTKILTLG